MPPRASTLSFALLSLAACASTPASSDQPLNRMTATVGGRQLDEDLWDPVDRQATLGFEYSRGNADTPIGFEVGVFGSEDTAINILGSSLDVEGKTVEVYGGARKDFGHGAFRPYVGGGLSWITAKFEGDTGSASTFDDDSSAAGYLHAGVDYFPSAHFFLGLDLRVLFGSDITLFGVDGDADYQQIGLHLGVAF